MGREKLGQDTGRQERREKSARTIPDTSFTDSQLNVMPQE